MDQDLPILTDLPIYICHYKKLTDRKEYLSNALKDFKNIKWFEDIDRDHLSQEQVAMYQYDPVRWVQNDPTNVEPRELSLPELAVTLTHISIYKYMIDNEVPVALVLEDDCVLLEKFSENLRNILNELNNNFDTCFVSNSFGWTVDNYKFSYYGLSNKNTYEPGRYTYPMVAGRTADAYLISLDGSKKIYNNIIPFCYPIDFEHNRIFAIKELNYHNFWAEPAIVMPGSNLLYKSANRDGRLKEDLDIHQIMGYSLIKGEIPCNLHYELESRSKEDLNSLIYKLENNINYAQAKFGDGEWRNMISDNEKDHNCDGSNYFKSLGIDLIKSYIFFLKNKDVYIHKWHSHIYNIQNAIENDYKEYYDPSKKFVFFDLIVHKLIKVETGTGSELEPYSVKGPGPDLYSFKYEQIKFFRTIKNSKRFKIYLSNEAMAKVVVPVFKIDMCIVVPPINCYLFKADILGALRYILDSNNISNSIVLFSCGMASKVFIYEMFRDRPNNTYIDVGSSLDGFIKRSRDFNGTQLYHDVLVKCYCDR